MVFVFWEWDGVGNDDFGDFGHFCEVDGGFAGEDAVCGGYEDVAGAVFSEALRSGGHGTAGGDFVVDKDGVATVNFTNDVVSFDAVVVAGASFLYDGERCFHEVCKVSGALDAADIRRYDDRCLQFFLFEEF